MSEQQSNERRLTARMVRYTPLSRLHTSQGVNFCETQLENSMNFSMATLQSFAEELEVWVETFSQNYWLPSDE
jgi:hypothetical protein